MLSIFVVHQTTHETHEIHLNAEQLHAEAIYIGRQPGCAILLPDSTVSRKHAQITLAGKEVRIVDLHSSGGTFYQGAALVPEEIVIIQEGADILIGPYQLRFNYAAQQQDQTQFPDEGKTKVV
ncbi:MAG TPA: FHA domain-containing protein, partial [Cellvibrionaceae bacterium]|nr:FHA domain-containing protein [Cellvibrionaceae bacterium]